MKIFRGFDALPRFRHPAVTVGSYDGVHCGHQVLLREVIRMAGEQKGESIVLTFEPHPRITLGKADGLRLLTTLEEKCLLLEQAGIDNLIVIPFDRAFSQLTPEAFVREYLIGRVGAETLVVGYNHRFGRDNEGDYSYLGEHGFGLRVKEIAECDIDARKVSSSVVRRLVEAGDMSSATRMMGHPYLLVGKAESGRLRSDEPLKLLPPAGEYRVRVNGSRAVATLETSGNIDMNPVPPDGKVVLTF